MKVLITGIPLFSKRLAEELSAAAPQHTIIFYDTYYSKSDRLRFAAALPFSDLVLSMNGVSDRSGSMELVARMKKKLWMQWQGTDVLLAKKRVQVGTILRKYIDRAVHFTDAPWLADELHSIGIPAGLIHFKWIAPTENREAFPSPAAYSYLAGGKESFYGWDQLNMLARNYPDIPFYIAGSDGDGLEKLPNLRFLGWVPAERMKEIRETTPVFIRSTRHDGYAYSVLEALSAGNEVLWTMPHPNCHLIGKDNAKEVFGSVIARLKNRALQRSAENISFVQRHFNREEVLKQLIERIEREIG